MNSRLKKYVAWFCLSFMILINSANCFGKFSLVRKVYGFHDSINIGSGLVSKFVKTLILYVFFFIPIYGVAFLVDFIVINLIEFWTDSNPVSLNDYDKNGEFTKTFQNEGKILKLTYMEYGNKLRVQFEESSAKEFYLIKNAPGKIYKEEKVLPSKLWIQKKWKI